jgi:hypothetical protein
MRIQVIPGSASTIEALAAANEVYRTVNTLKKFGAFTKTSADN